MNWIDFPENRPKSSGAFLTSIERSLPGGDTYTFKYLAHYDHGENKWYKYDPYNVGHEIHAEMTDKVNGWIEDIPVYLR